MTILRRSILAIAALMLVHAASAEVKDGRYLNRYATTERSWGVNAYWLESDQGLVLIDALFLIPDAENLAALLKSRNKPLLGVLLTHPHVDHFGGLGVIRKHFPEVPIYATQGAIDNVQKVHDEAVAAGWIGVYGQDYTSSPVIPDQVVASGSTLKLGDMHFDITSLGAMESADNAVIYSHEFDVLFTGDAVMNGAVYYLGEGHSHGVLKGLKRIAQNYPAKQRAFPSHGEPGRLGPMLKHESAQVSFMREQVREAAERPKAVTAEGRLSDGARARLVGVLSEHFRHYQTFGLGAETLALMNLGGIEPEVLAELSLANKTAERTAAEAPTALGADSSAE